MQDRKEILKIANPFTSHVSRFTIHDCRWG
jgi:hypothetical protein